jgi:hypothetical protein
VVCLTTKGRQLERNFEELKPALHVPNLGTILNIFDVFVAVFFSPLTVDSNFFHGPIKFEITRVNCRSSLTYFIVITCLGLGLWTTFNDISVISWRSVLLVEETGEFDGTMEKIRVNRSSTQEELRRYRKCGLFNNERETTRAKF